ncbi:uncharacterized protein TNCV_4027331 [Trichonephila clavipes]|nr:uncharacterized protein TNCV_4027331 [Trichonephila clavipes]
MSSSCRLLSNDTFHDSMHRLAPEEIETQSRVDKNTEKPAFTGFNRIDNIFSLINSETRGNIRFHFHAESRLIGIYIRGFQECDDDVETWMACDAEVYGFQMLNKHEIVTSVQEEIDLVDDEMDKDEDINNESSKVHQMLKHFLR